MNRLGRLGATTLALLIALATLTPTTQAQTAKPGDCVDAMDRIRFMLLEDTTEPLVLKSYGSPVPMAMAWEKEGTPYREIAEFFDTVEQKAFSKKLRAHAKKGVLVDDGYGPRGPLRVFLKKYPTHYASAVINIPPAEWAKLTLEGKLRFLTRPENPFSLINTRGRGFLFDKSILSFDDLRPSAATPEWLLVSDDLGSYEVKSFGTTDLRQHVAQRSVIEQALEGKVGHEHRVHAWPEDPKVRAEIAPFYIEHLDASSWYQFWRSMNSSPENSLVFHDYLGLYTRSSLKRLHQAMVDGRPKSFNDKFRMEGARRLKNRDPNAPPELEYLPDIEHRVGPKAIKRDEYQTMFDARITSGDYSGLRDFRSYNFDPSTDTRTLLAPFANGAQIETFLKMEKVFKALEFNPSPLAKNHFRNKILAPLLPWQDRIDVAYKADILKRAQQRYADRLMDLTKEFQPKLEKARAANPKDYELIDALETELQEGIEKAAYQFAASARLDKDFLRYLTPQKIEMPSILVRSGRKIDVNKIDLGIENSFRFERRFTHRSQIREEVKKAAEAFRDEMGGGRVVEETSGGGHGHGLSTRFLYTDPKGRVWRFEHDGVQRKYRMGKEAKNVFGGHLEVPTPKFAPQDMTELQALYRSLRNRGLQPERRAGGSHLNIDMSPLQALPPKEGAAMVANFIKEFENNNAMVRFLWQHPGRTRVAVPVDLTDDAVRRLNEFDGDWDDLGKLLYDIAYYNTTAGRKPKYTQLNATGLMGKAVPAEKQVDIDIVKSRFTKWYEAFGTKSTGRIELRLPDAMPSEHELALQIRYFRALMNKGFNAPKGSVKLASKFDDTAQFRWIEHSDEWLKAAKAHFEDLGLDWRDYQGIIADAWELRQQPLDGIVKKNELQLQRRTMRGFEEEF